MATTAAVLDAVVVEQVQVAYGPTVALDGIGVRVAPGATLAVLGHNGAGKTSLIRVMTTAIRPDRGRVIIDGVDAIQRPAEVRRRIGVTGQYAGLDDFLTTGENLELVGRLVGLRGASRGRARDLVEATIPAHRIRELPRRPDATEPVEHGRVGVSFVLPDAAAAAQLVGAVAASSIELTDLDVSSPSLDDVFFHLATAGAPT